MQVQAAVFGGLVVSDAANIPACVDACSAMNLQCFLVLLILGGSGLVLRSSCINMGCCKTPVLVVLLIFVCNALVLGAACVADDGVIQICKVGGLLDLLHVALGFVLGDTCADAGVIACLLSLVVPLILTGAGCLYNDCFDCEGVAVSLQCRWSY